jgi:hypothetical protein
MIQEKRKSLVAFIEKNLIGPGAMNHIFEISGEPDADITNIHPARLFHSGILFPIDKSAPQNAVNNVNEGDDGQPEDAGTPDDKELETVLSVNNEIDNDPDKDDNEAVVLETANNNLYPNKMGLTFRLNNSENLQIKISFRIYRKITLEELKKLGLDLTEELPKDFFEKKDGKWCFIFEEKGEQDAEKIWKGFRNKLGKYLNDSNNGINEDIKSKLKNLLPSNNEVFWVGKREEKTFNQIPESGTAIYEQNIIVGKPAQKLVLHTKKVGAEGHIKLLLENQSVYPLADNDNLSINRYSNKRDSVNLTSFYGLEIKAVSNELLPYRDFKDEMNVDDNSFDNIPYSDKEEKNINFLYRKQQYFAIGHGVSVKWDINNPKSVSTTFLPEYDLPNVSPVQEAFLDQNGNYPLLKIWSLSTFSNVNDNGIIIQLNEFIEKYKSFLKTAKQDFLNTPGNDTTRLSCRLFIDNFIKACKDCERIQRNIELLKNNAEALKAFRLMNTAMYIQMYHGKKVGSNEWDKDDNNRFKLGNTFNYSNNYIQKDFDPEWRPFQLAFILLNVDAFVRPDTNQPWDEREKISDMVWFPTGGGKTEAYLGIIGFYLILRRLRNTADDGTGVLMRYTLRLLTMQQFQRATRLIMALEIIRSANNLGNTPFSIGLFVGSSTLPNSANKLYDLIKSIRTRLNNNNPLNSPLPFNACPCCGTKYYYKVNNGYIFRKGLNDDEKRWDFICKNTGCYFGQLDGDNQPTLQLLMLLTDDGIYKNPPSLLFGTVDKFAQIAHKVSNTPEEDSRRIFGYRHGANSVTPPELIIQDELHLLNGSLGSGVGFFERAVLHLCTNNEGLPPKIITSTATTRNSELQIMGLFGKQCNIFPKPLDTFDESFFATPQKENGLVVSNRKYLGVLPTGRAMILTQLYLIALCLTHRKIWEKENDGQPNADEALDYYHTMVAYYNNLKELGKTVSQKDTFLKSEIDRILSRFSGVEFDLSRDYTHKELTSRISSSEIKETLNNISEKYSVGNPPSLVFATNMISVGIDISRWNTMLITGMPKNIAEYIQSSSRVARDKAGLAITLHHPMRPRDISHYEKFLEFHSSYYAFVEPLSLTPFTLQTVDRFCSTFLAAIIRHKFPNLASNNQAHGLNANWQDITNEINNILQKEIAAFDALPEHKSLIKELFTAEHVNSVTQSLMPENNNIAEYAALFGLWKVKHSLRDVEENLVLSVEQQ